MFNRLLSILVFCLLLSAAVPLTAQEISLEHVRTFGDLNNPDENYMLFRPFDAARTADGTVFILDTGNNRIQVFGGNGKYLRTIGRKGAGPGELGDAYSMNRWKDELRVCDVSNQRIQRYSLDGEDLGSVRMGARGGKRLTHFRMFSTGEYISRPAPFMYPNDDPATVPLLSVMNNDCVYERGIGAGRIEKFDDFVMTVCMSVFIYEIDSRDNVLGAFAFQNRVAKFSKEGELLFEVDRPLKIKLKKNPKGPGEMVQVAAAVAVDGKDRLWVSTLIAIPDRTAPQDEKKKETQYLVLEVFSPDGKLLQTMEQPGNGTAMPLNPLSTQALDNMRICGDRIFFIDPFEKMCVHEYRIVER